MKRIITKKTAKLFTSLLIVVLLAVASRYLPESTVTKSVVSDTVSKVEQNQPGLYKVTKFVDGDTIIVSMDGKNQTIRFIGVDTPEEFDRRKPVQCFAKAAAEHTKNLIGGDTVRLVADPLSDNHDRYDRLLRYVYTPDNLLVNKQIIADGYGFTITGFPFTKMDEFRTAQTKARQQNKGLWAGCTINYPKGYPQTNPVGPAPTHAS